MEAPRIEDRGSFLVAGTIERYKMPDTSGIPQQWTEFAKSLGTIPGQAGWITYGLCIDVDGGGTMDYMCAVEVADGSPVPDGLRHLRVAARQYAVFSHREHITKIKDTWMAIFDEWLPSSGKKPARAPQFEVYDERFDPATGNGVVEIWIPIEG